MSVRSGADTIGLVSAMPSGPGVIDDELAREIARGVPPAVSSFLLTSLQEAAGIIEQQRFVGASVLQLVDTLTGGTSRR